MNLIKLVGIGLISAFVVEMITYHRQEKQALAHMARVLNERPENIRSESHWLLREDQ